MLHVFVFSLQSQTCLQQREQQVEPDYLVYGRCIDASVDNCYDTLYLSLFKLKKTQNQDLIVTNESRNIKESHVDGQGTGSGSRVSYCVSNNETKTYNICSHTHNTCT